MLLKDYYDTFYTYSGKASDVCRQLAFAAIAIVWIFKADAGSKLILPFDLVLSGFFVVLALALDLFQYALASLTWYLFYRWLETRRFSATQEIHHSVWLERPLSLIFWLKVLCVIVAYCIILRFLLHSLEFA